MANKGSKGGSRKGGANPRSKRKAEKSGALWRMLAIVALIGSIIQLASVGLANWRTTDTVSYHYFNSRNNPLTTVYQPTSFGLYLVRFNGGVTVSPWFRLAQTTCTGVDYMSPLANAASTLRLWDSSCDTICLSHWRARCAIYKKQGTLGYATMGVIALGATVAIVGVGWTFVIGASPSVLHVCWTGTGSCAFAMLLWYVWSSDDNFNVLRTGSEYPYPSLAAAFYACAVGVATVLTAGLCTSIASYIDRQKKWKAKQEAIRKKAMEESGEPFGDMPSDFPTAPGANIAMRPMSVPGMPPPMGPPGLAPRPGFGPPPMGRPMVAPQMMGMRPTSIQIRPGVRGPPPFWG